MIHVLLSMDMSPNQALQQTAPLPGPPLSARVGGRL